MNDFKSESFNLDTQNPNHEEVEDEEEYLRRQEEIKNLLDVAMGDFNYDESTLNSLNSSVDVDVSRENLQQKYKETDVNQTLKALYEVRTKDIEKLSNKLKEVEKEKSKFENEKHRQVICLEAELDQLKISLKNSESLNVNNIIEINQLKEEKELLSKNYQKVNEKFEDITEERNALREANGNLHQQVYLLEKGLSPKLNAKKEEEQQFINATESLKLEVDRLEKTIKKKENEFATYKQMIERILHEKDQFVNDRDKEIKTISLELYKKEMENASLHANITNLKKEKEDLKQTIQKFKTTEFYTTNLNDKLYTQNEEIQKLKNEIEKSKYVELELEKSREKFQRLQRTVSNLEAENTNKENIKTWTHTDDKSTQVEKIQSNSLGVQINTAEYLDFQLLQKLKDLEEENNFLKLKDSERKGQELLLIDLQKKAQELERMINENNSKIYVSVSTNTDENILEGTKIYYETQIVKLETQLRQKIQEEFNKKLQERENLMSKQTREIKKTSSIEMENQLGKLMKQIKEDRQATVELLNVIRQDFLFLEKELNSFKSKYSEAEFKNTELTKSMLQLQAILGNQKNFKALIVLKEEMLKKKVSDFIGKITETNKKISDLQG